MKTTIFASIALGLCTVGLTACGEQPAEEALPEGMANVTVTNGRIVLPAVKGNPAALYFDIVNNGSEYLMLRKVQVQGGKGAKMHDTVEQGGVTGMAPIGGINVAAGEPVSLKPGGKHVMINELDPGLQAGGTTPVALTFVGGDQYQFDAKIEAPGGAD